MRRLAWKLNLPHPLCLAALPSLAECPERTLSRVAGIGMPLRNVVML